MYEGLYWLLLNITNVLFGIQRVKWVACLLLGNAGTGKIYSETNASVNSQRHMLEWNL